MEAIVTFIGISLSVLGVVLAVMGLLYGPQIADKYTKWKRRKAPKTTKVVFYLWRASYFLYCRRWRWM